MQALEQPLADELSLLRALCWRSCTQRFGEPRLQVASRGHRARRPAGVPPVRRCCCWQPLLENSHQARCRRRMRGRGHAHRACAPSVFGTGGCASERSRTMRPVQCRPAAGFGGHGLRQLAASAWTARSRRRARASLCSRVRWRRGGSPWWSCRMRVLLVDDEPAARARLRRLLGRACRRRSGCTRRPTAPARRWRSISSAALRACCCSTSRCPAAAACSWRRSCRRRTRCVFSTAYAEHALRAFDSAPSTTCSSPIAPSALAATLERVRAQLALPTPPARLASRCAEQAWVETREGIAAHPAAPRCNGCAPPTTTWCIHLPAGQLPGARTLAAVLERRPRAGCSCGRRCGESGACDWGGALRGWGAG